MNEQALQTTTAPVWNAEQIQLLRDLICKDATEDEMRLFSYACQRTGLDPFCKQIYFQKRVNRKSGKSEMTILTGIDGYRLVAFRTGLHAGTDDAVLDNEREPNKATITVYKLIGNVRCPFTASARWDEYYPGDAMGFMWKKMPCTMLSKCAEALALRKAFPAELSGIYTKEEMEQADREEARREATTQRPATLPPVQAKAAEEIFTGTDEQTSKLVALLESRDVPDTLWQTIGDKLKGRPYAALSQIVPPLLKEFRAD